MPHDSPRGTRTPVPKRRFGPLQREVGVIGQGTWYIEEGGSASAIAALRRGIDLGMTHIDTAEMYGAGAAEKVVGDAIADRRDEVFLVSKVMPQNASRQGTKIACERSLTRLKTGWLDCYLLHWPGSHPLEDTFAAFDTLREEGKILSWGVSNFDVPDLEEAWRIAGDSSIVRDRTCRIGLVRTAPPRRHRLQPVRAWRFSRQADTGRPPACGYRAGTWRDCATDRARVSDAVAFGLPDSQGIDRRACRRECRRVGHRAVAGGNRTDRCRLSAWSAPPQAADDLTAGTGDGGRYSSRSNRRYARSHSLVAGFLRSSSMILKDSARARHKAPATSGNRACVSSPMARSLGGSRISPAR